MRTVLAFMLLLLPILASAQYGSGDKFEASFSVLYQGSDSIGGNDTGEGGVPNTSSLSLDSTWGIGLNLGYRFNQNFTLGINLEYLNPDYDLYLVPDSDLEDPVSISHNGYQFNGRIVGTFTLKDEGFTPYLDAGIGWTQLDTNVIDGPPVTGCWWHPWWGYICSNFYDTFTETAFTYGVGAGIRFDTPAGNFFKLGYSHWVLDAAPSASDFALGSARLEFGRVF